MSNPSDLLNQAKSAATAVASTVVSTATSAVNQATVLAGQAANSDAAASVTSSAKSLGSQAASTAGSLAGQAHAQAHALAPTVIPVPAAGVAEGVDNRGDLSPTDEVGKAKFEKLFESRHSADELKDKGILKGAPGDSLAGKRADLEKAMHKDQLDKEIAQRPQPEELVKKGILNPDEAPPTQ
ncbi:hypothetical protein L486_06426 [Kwoniella mangroviensis CBS 10435]|uniref:Uncharacterized protein n=1 Tax=Kwoniella mangroviensis CBS 10435 TaxID=1331196 RepID=A0A1B9IJF1_9TREE|nr:uncharacterized protein I203_05123 [Kwoniella mangroviensis CBS 8507]OCF55675.1 hypothetical protein L486_06426 [Kwoniella mangroviensis CBS 10435]OCF65448.1 hypothetical protein I203_05123 [Kwoniella mangroviensis CBS 8507]